MGMLATIVAVLLLPLAICCFGRIGRRLWLRPPPCTARRRPAAPRRGRRLSGVRARTVPCWWSAAPVPATCRDLYDARLLHLPGGDVAVLAHHRPADLRGVLLPRVPGGVHHDHRRQRGGGSPFVHGQRDGPHGRLARLHHRGAARLPAPGEPLPPRRGLPHGPGRLPGDLRRAPALPVRPGPGLVLRGELLRDGTTAPARAHGVVPRVALGHPGHRTGHPRDGVTPGRDDLQLEPSWRPRCCRGRWRGRLGLHLQR